MTSKIDMGTIGVSGVSLVSGIVHANTLSSLTKEVDNLKKSMKGEDTNTGIFEDTEVETENIDAGLTPIEQIEEVVKAAETTMTSVSTVPNEISNLRKKVNTETNNIGNLDTKIADTTENIQPLLDVSAEMEEIVREYKLFSGKSHISDGGQFHGEDCNIGLIGNRGDLSAIHMAGLKNKKWAMYMGHTSGRGPSTTSSTIGRTPPSHGKVTGEALRMRVGGESNEGIIMENEQGEGVFSIGSTGRMSAGPAVFGDIDSETVGFAHIGKLSPTNFAVAQTKTGTTKLNASADQELQLCTNGNPVVWLNPLGALIVKNKEGSANTVFNNKGENSIVCSRGSTTEFDINGSTTPILLTGEGETRIHNKFYINGKNLMTTLDEISTRMTALDGKSSTSTSTSTTSSVFISTPEPYDPIPAIITNSDRITLQNVGTGNYLNVNGSTDGVLLPNGVNPGLSTYLFIETQNRTNNVNNNERILLKSRLNNRYLKWISKTSITATSTSVLDTKSHFLIRNLESTTIREGDTVTLYSIGGGTYVRSLPATSRTIFGKTVKTDASVTTVGGSRTDPNSQYIINII